MLAYTIIKCESYGDISIDIHLEQCGQYCNCWKLRWNRYQSNSNIIMNNMKYVININNEINHWQIICVDRIEDDHRDVLFHMCSRNIPSYMTARYVRH